MNVAEELDREIPYLRRYARAVTGDSARGDRILASVCREILHSNDRPVGRVGLFKALDQVFTRLQVDDHCHEIAALSCDARRAFLLTAMEGFSVSDTATVMSCETDAVSALISAAEQDLAASLATEVFIIEDEPLVAAHIAQIAQSMGHRVTGQAVTRDSAVRRCLQDRPGLVVADVQLADGSSGAEAAEEIVTKLGTPVVFVTAYPQRLLTGERGEPAFLVPKPFRPDMVKAVMSQALIQHAVRNSAKKNRRRSAG